MFFLCVIQSCNGVFAYGSPASVYNMRIKQSLEKENHEYALCQSMMQLIKGQSHFL